MRYISRCRMTSLRESATMGSVSIKRGRVTEEWLNAKAKTARKYSTLFYRGTADEELDLSGFPKSSRDNIQVALEKQVFAGLFPRLMFSDKFDFFNLFPAVVLGTAFAYEGWFSKLGRDGLRRVVQVLDCLVLLRIAYSIT